MQELPKPPSNKMSSAEREALVKRISLLTGLSQPALRKFSDPAVEVHIGYGWGIRQSLDPQNTCYIVRNGQVKIHDGAGERILGSGDFFGEGALLDVDVTQPYRSLTTVVSKEGADLLLVRRNKQSASKPQGGMWTSTSPNV